VKDATMNGFPEIKSKILSQLSAPSANLHTGIKSEKEKENPGKIYNNKK